jgi:hypothetical protein
LADYVELTIEAGTDFETEVTVGDAFQSPKDLEDYDVFAQLRKSYYSSSAIDFDISIDSPNDGIITLTLSSDVTSSVRPGRYVYDVNIKNRDTNKITRIFEGIATITPTATKIEH